jgi:ubiquinone/menaquinone biosynthesis C-methylase UbiE
MTHSHPIVAAIYDRMRQSEERGFFGSLRDEMVGLAEGSVVEVGVGTGLDFSHYRPASIQRLCVVEPDPHMHRQAERRAATVNFAVEFLDGTAEHLPLPDHSVDTLVATLLLCSVDDPAQVGREMRRVLKDAGKLLFIEHVRAATPWRAVVQDCLAPLWRQVAANCHPNRASLTLLGQAGFAVREVQRISAGMPLDRPLVAGIAGTA